MKRFLFIVFIVAAVIVSLLCAGKAGDSYKPESAENSAVAFTSRSESSKAPCFSSAAPFEDSSVISEDSECLSSEDSECVSSEDSKGIISEDSKGVSSEGDGESSRSPVTPPGVWVNDLKNQQSRDRQGFSDAELDAYFDGVLFVGDSVAQGLKLYKNMYEKDIFKNMIFNTGAAYGYHNCLMPVSGKSLHPLYQGAKRTIWEMVSLTGAKTVFIGFGLNDFGYATPGSLKRCLDKIRANISAVNPNAEVIILSAGNFTRDGESYVPAKNDYRTCARHRDYNQYILEYCNAEGLDYIDVTNCFADDYGYLPKESSMDNYCHPKIELYSVWRDILYGYAADKLLGTYHNPPRMK